MSFESPTSLRRAAAASPGARRSELGDIAMRFACAAFAVTSDDIRAPTRRSAEAALARQVAMYLTHVAFQVPLNEVGRLYARDRSTAAHACHVVEDLRDDPAFDACLDHLEQAMRAVRTMRGVEGAAP